MKRSIAFVMVALVLGGAAFLAYRIWRGRPQIDRAARIVPADSFFYGTLLLDPSNDQKRALRDFLRRFPGTGSPEEAADALGKLLDGPLSAIGLDYATDVDPWLGDQVSIFSAPGTGGEPVAAALFATTDADAASEAAARALDEGSGDAAYAVEDGFLVVGDAEAVDQVVERESDTTGLWDSRDYQRATADIADDRVALLYTNLRGLVGLTGPGGALLPDPAVLETVGMDLDRPSATVVSLQPDALILESSAGAPLAGALGPIVLSDGSVDLLGDLPQGAWLALGISDLGDTLGSYLALAERSGVSGVSAGIESVIGVDVETELLPWMGDGALFLEGDSLIGSTGGLVVDAVDAGASLAAVAEAGDHLEALGGEVEELDEGELEGFMLSFPGLPASVDVLGGERFLLAYGRGLIEELLEPDRILRDNETYGRALDDLGRGYVPTLFVDFEKARELIEAAGVAFGGGLDPAYEENVRPWLEPLLHVTIGARRVGDDIVQRTAIGVR